MEYPFGASLSGPQRAQEDELTGITATPASATPRPNIDGVIFDALQAGDPHSLELLYDRYGAPAYSLALHLSGDATVAERLVTEAFTALWQDRQTLAGPEALQTRLLARVSHSAAQLAEQQSATNPPQTQAAPAPGKPSRARQRNEQRGRVTFSVLLCMRQQ